MSNNAQQSHVLVVDDDVRLRSLLVKYLSENDFLVSAAADAASARVCLQSIHFDVIILDLMMPGESGLDFAKKIKRINNIPILMLTAMSAPEDRICGLEGGADDYLVKPFEPRELVLRLNNILKHSMEKVMTDKDIKLGDLVFNLYRGELKKNDYLIKLTEIEISLLKVLSNRGGQIINRDDLIELTGANGGGRAVDVQVTRLRRKIEPNPKMPRYLQTVRGHGYVLKPD
jgi:two-component system phosphate regulon response regulator OmpR